MEPYLYTAVYQTPGAARNLDYDSVLFGTSMSENSHTSWFDEEMGWHTAKLIYAGARSADLGAILAQIFHGNRQVKHIIMDINDYQLTVTPDTFYTEEAHYLYDINPFNDIKYLLNKGVIGSAFTRLIAFAAGMGGNMDEAYSWIQHYSKEKVQQAYYDTGIGVTEFPVLSPDNIRQSLEICKRNLDSFAPYIKAHPETQFIIFYPPYSLAYWQMLRETGRLEERIAVYQYSIEYLLNFDNVQIYYFQDEDNIISNLEIYCDLCHHIPEINRYIFECIRDGEKRLTADNYQNVLDNMYYFARDYDYDSLWEK